MIRTLIDRLDPELKGPIEIMNQAGTMSFDDLPAARAGLNRIMEAMRKQSPILKGIIKKDRTIPGPKGSPDVIIRI